MEDIKLRKNLAEEEIDRKKGFYQTVAWLTFLLYLVAIFIVIGLNRFSVVVEGTSMVPTLQDGDFLVANSNRTIKRYDVVIIDTDLAHDRDDDWVVKRIIGLPNETITIEDGIVYLGSGEQKVALEEDYVSGLTEWPNSSYIIGQGEYFYLGDNRKAQGSFDSRLGGNCTRQAILGVVEGWSLTMRPINNCLSQLFTN